MTLSRRATLNGRVPVFAVSASLLEKEREKYLTAGFDGWILKPVDFKRLDTLLAGIVIDDKRVECLYKPGEWEKGGWFEKRRPDVFTAETAPSKEKSVRLDRGHNELDVPPEEARGTNTTGVTD